MKDKRLKRLLQIILLFKDGFSIPTAELRKKFQVSERTLERDIESICEAGLVLISLRRTGDGIWHTGLLREAK